MVLEFKIKYINYIQKNNNLIFNTKFLNNFKFLYGNKIKKNKIFDILH